LAGAGRPALGDGGAHAHCVTDFGCTLLVVAVAIVLDCRGLAVAPDPDGVVSWRWPRSSG
jgi:hypothetical protein